ncbi:MAG: hypothetical protein ACTHW2_11855 [Tissierella sp.]|uniref:hypothetical protein n=1 Tax=Tissierella sp. TaxID=41274 RepID=UPI003F94DCC7
MYKVKLLDLPRNIDYLKIKDTYIFNELYVNGIDCAKLLARIIERGKYIPLKLSTK